MHTRVNTQRFVDTKTTWVLKYPLIFSFTIDFLILDVIIFENFHIFENNVISVELGQGTS
jgi:hypothetical protein